MNILPVLILLLLSDPSVTLAASAAPAVLCKETLEDLRAHSPDFTFEKLSTAEIRTFLDYAGAPPIAAFDEVWMVTSRDNRAELEFVHAGCVLIYTDVMQTTELLRLIGRVGV